MSSGSWRGAHTLNRQTASDRVVARGQTNTVLEGARGRSLVQRAVRAPDKAAQPAPADEILRDVLVSKELPLQLWLPEQLSNGKIDFDCVQRGGFYCLVEGQIFQAHYLGQNCYGRNFIDLPLEPGNGEPRYLLTPSLRDDFVGIKYREHHIRVTRDYNYLSGQDFLFAPEGRSVRQKKISKWEYRSFSREIHKGGDSREKSKGYENVFWGQFSCMPNRSTCPKWFFNCQNFVFPDRIRIDEISIVDSNISVSLHYPCKLPSSPPEPMPLHTTHLA